MEHNLLPGIWLSAKTFLRLVVVIIKKAGVFYFSVMQPYMISLQNNQGMWQPVKFSEKEFRDIVINIFPEIEKDVDKESGVHVIFGYLTERCQTAIKDGEFTKLKNLFEILDKVISLKDSDPEIEIGIKISFLESTDFADPKNGKKVFELLPQKLKQIILAA